MKIAVGSTNNAKLEAARLAVLKMFPKAVVVGVSVKSNVSDQPKSDKESIEGALNRARAAQKKTRADFGIGMEGGIQKIGKSWFESGWIAVVDKKGNLGLGSSARFEMSGKLAKELLSGRELRDVINELTNRTDVHETDGAMGVLTAGHLKRAEAYTHGIIFAFAPFLSDKKFWK